MSKVYVFTDYGGPDNQQLIEREVPQPGPGELGVKVHAAGVNPLDWKIRSGVSGPPRELPAPLGEEVSGTVTAVGDGVEGFAVGDEVLGLVADGAGGYAEDTVLAAESAVVKPEEISFTDAAVIPIAGATAYAGTHQVELEAGQGAVGASQDLITEGPNLLSLVPLAVGESDQHVLLPSWALRSPGDDVTLDRHESRPYRLDSENNPVV